MAVIDQQVIKCHEQRSKKEGGGAAGARESAEARLQEKEMGDNTVCSGNMDSKLEQLDDVVMQQQQEDEPQEYKEWRERERHYLDYLERVTSHPAEGQVQLLKEILQKNANTAYLQQFGLNGATDVETFRERVPVGDYDGIRPFTERIIAGERGPLLSGDPVVEMQSSSGTTSGEPKLYPITEEDKRLRGVIWTLMRPVLNRIVPGLDKGKCMFFYFILPSSKVHGSLQKMTAVTSFIKSDYFQKRPFDPSYRLTSPDIVIEAGSLDESYYCHLILGLVQREEVFRLGAIFSSAFVKAMRSLEEWWPEICDDIEKGTLSEKRVPQRHVREAVLPSLRPDPSLAESVRKVCKSGWEGVIRKLWPNAMVIDTICTGTMEAYTPTLHYYSDGLPIICTQLYAATEGYFGINLNPACIPEEIYYTLLPTMAYYEFIPVTTDVRKEDHDDEILDLASIKVGQEYEILVTTVSGLCRYRVGDILKMVGHYNKTPTMQFLRRRNTVLSIDTDKTDEKELNASVTRAVKLLENSLGLRLQDYTSLSDVESSPGHYVIFMELASNDSITEPISTDLLEQCCELMDAALNVIYRRNRNLKIIGPLELRIVKPGTFDELANLAYCRGASPAQYKTPRGLSLVKHGAQLGILNSAVVQKAFSQILPPLALSASSSSSSPSAHRTFSGRVPATPQEMLPSPKVLPT
ncbi:hypothetical protein Mapa_015583 [Marchantia paleacea]|nr:hypothetical protein Mapa_015583 [Marchantia paleacea]